MASFERIIVGTDYSECSRVALKQGAALARETHAELHVVHVMDLLGENPLVDVYRAAVDAAGLRETLQQKSGELMESQLRSANVADLDVETAHIEGARVADTLRRYAVEHKAQTVVVGTHGRHGVRRLLVGSVARALVASSEVPVLVARSRKSASVSFRKILAPIDLSNSSMQVLLAAQRLASALHGTLDFVHVLEHYAIPVSLSEIKTIRDLVPDIESRVRDLAEQRIAELEGPYIPNRFHVREGDPASIIIALADELSSDLIVMTRRGMSAGRRFLVGSVTEKVLHGAGCSLYVEPLE